MSGHLPARGETVRWNGGTWRAENLGAGSVELRNILSGERHALSLVEWTGGLQTRLIERHVRPPKIGSGMPRRGTLMRWQGSTWRVSVVRNGIISLVNSETDETSGIPVRDWQVASFEGDAEIVESVDSQVDPRTQQLLNVPISSMTPSMQKQASYMALFFDAWRAPEKFYEEHLPHLPIEERRMPGPLSAPRVKPFLRIVAAAHGVQPPSFSGFCKWMAKARKANGDIRAAVPRHDLQGPHARYMNPRVEQWLNEAIDKIWLTQNRNKKVAVYNELCSLIDDWNVANPERPMVCPSSGHVARYIREVIDREVIMRRRRSVEDAKRAFRQVGKGAQSSEILERVEVDHTAVKLRVKDDETGVALGYPWITAALDHYSRMPLAAHVNFESQSLGATLQCMRQVMMPKAFLPELVPDIDYDFPCGVPYSFFFDRGSDFDSESIRYIGQSLDIIIDYEPAGCPEYKGAIERWWRTLKEDIIYNLPGSARRGEAVVAGVDADGEPFITYSELVRRLWHWMTLVYAKSHHRGINDVPLRRWQESYSRVLPRALRKKDDLNILLTRVEECQPSVQGVTYDGLTWTGDVLQSIIQHPSWRPGMKVRVRIDEFDVSKAWVINPFSLRDEALTPKLTKYMKGLSLHAHDRIRKYAPKRDVGTLDERMLMAARRQLWNKGKAAFEEAAQRADCSVSAPITKFMGFGQMAPAGSSLHGVRPPDPAPKPAPENFAPQHETDAQNQDAPPPRRKRAVRMVKNHD